MSHNSNYVSERSEYVDIHGNDIRVVICEKTGEILVPIDALKHVGFTIYRKSQYNKLLVDDKQFNQEFKLYILQCAKTYILMNKVAFRENEILESIDNCKKILTEGGSYQPSTNFLKDHMIKENVDNINVTSNVKEPQFVSPPNDQKFKGYNKQKRSPSSSVNSFVTKNPNYEQKRQNSSDFNKPRHSLESSSNSSLEQTRPRHSFESQNSNNNFERRAKNSFDQNSNNPDQKSNRIFDQNMSVIEPRKPRNFNTNNSSPKPQNPTNLKVENENDEKKIPTIELNMPEHDVIVSFLEKSNCVWVQDQQKMDTLLDIYTRVKESVANQKVASKTELHTMYLAEEEDMWYRCKIIKFKPLTVFFIDYGNVAQVSEVREIPEELTKIPGQAVRITFDDSYYQPQSDEDLRIRVKKRFENGTYSVEILKNEKTALPLKEVKIEVKPEPITTYFVRPEPLGSLKNGDRVMIIGESDGRLVLRTRDAYEKLKQIEQKIENCPDESLQCVDVGQIVLCNKNGKYYRSQVTSVKSKEIGVEFLDYYETMTVDLSKLKNINESLFTEPVTCIISPPMKDFKQEGFNEECKAFIQKLVDNKSKGLVVLSGTDFDLKLNDGSLSEKLKDLCQPSVDLSNRTLLKDMEMYKPKTGVGLYIIYTFVDSDNVTMVAYEALESYLENIIKTDLDDSEPYEPIVGEVCFGSYQESWSRCVVQRIVDNKYEVKFIDFGNLEMLKLSELRKLSDDVKATPILGIPCNLIGLPPRKNVEALVKNEIESTDSYEVEVKVKKFNGESYEIEIPSLYDKLKNSA